MMKIIKEFLVIVSGVLVALVLESAWQDWMDQRLMGDYIKRLNEEVEFNLGEFELDRRWAEISCKSGQSAYDLLWASEDSETEQGKLLLNTFIAALNRTPLYRLSTYMDLVSTGRLSLLENSLLREQIISFYEGRPAAETWRPKKDNPYREIIFRTVPPDWANDVVRCITTDSAEYAPGWEECRLASDDEAEGLLEELRTSPGMRDHMAKRVYDLCNYPIFLDRNQRELLELQSVLGKTSQ